MISFEELEEAEPGPELVCLLPCRPLGHAGRRENEDAECTTLCLLCRLLERDSGE